MSGRCPDIETCKEKLTRGYVLRICLKDYKKCWKHWDTHLPKEWVEKEKLK